MKNSEYFAIHFTKHFTQKPSPQQSRETVSFKMFSSVNPIGPIKNWGKSSRILCMKERIKIIDHSQHIGRLNTGQI